MVKNKYNVKVKIKENLKKSLVFGIQARLPVAMILGFSGYRHEVVELMQVLSHGTRAYILNANSLQGFLNSVEIMSVLRARSHEVEALRC